MKKIISISSLLDNRDLNVARLASNFKWSFLNECFVGLPRGYLLLVLQTSCKNQSSEIAHKNLPDNTSLLEKVRFYSVNDLDFEVFNASKGEFSKFYNKTYNPKLFLDAFYQPWNYVPETNSTKINEFYKEYFTYETGIAAGKNSKGEIIPNGSPCFTGNLQEYSKKYINELKANLPDRTNDFLNAVSFGITIETTDLKGLPTNEFCFKRIRNSGEGYPFDELQYTTLWVGTPITILEKSKDNTWYFVQSTYGKGWVKSKSIALVNKEQINEIIQSKKVVVIGDNVQLNGKSSTYKVFTGTVLPYDTKTKDILFPTKSPLDNKLVFDRVKRQSSLVRDFPIAFKKENVQIILSQMIGGKYSWGGIDGGRDCSSTLKDYFTAFGIWLPRNSKAQRFSGKVDSLQHMSIEEKTKEISEKGVPFLSTLYLPGHIVLYVGKGEASQIQMYHTIWGLKAYNSDPELYNVMKLRERYGIYGLRERENNKVETRPVIGKTVITDIELEKPLRKIPNLWVKPYLENMEILTNPSIKE